MRWIADAVYLLAGLVYLPVALYHALIVGKNRRGWRQRFGAVPALQTHHSRIWIHAVSLGEMNATPRLADALRERLPDVDMVFSTTTDTGYARGVQLYGEDRVFRFPLDFSPVIAAALGRIRPSLIVLVELEVWYNLTRMATQRGVPVAVVNGRMTERSARRLRRLGRFARAMFRDLAWVGVQDETIAARFRAAGVPGERVEVTSSMKWDTATITDHVDGADNLARALGIDGSRHLLVCGSTGDGEERLILEAHAEILRTQSERGRDRKGADFSGLNLALVPRKPERFEEVARLIESHGYKCIRRSSHPDGACSPPPAAGSVILGDTMGELRKFYSLADLVFVGRSLVPLGGSDPMEVAGLGKPMIVGPHTENFDAPVRAFCEASAIRIVDSPASLARAAEEMLDNPDLARGMGAKARSVVRQNQGATARTANRLAELLVPHGRR